MAMPSPPVAPMLAKLARHMPSGDMLYEPKWDGFRCLVFRDGSSLHLQSRSGKDLGRYFPELVEQSSPYSDVLRARLPARIVVDGEIVVPVGARLDFDALSNRIHPAASRIAALASTTPAHFVAFDLLGLDGDDLTSLPFAERRTLLASALDGVSPPVHLTPATTDAAVASEWFERFEGAGLDGVIAKPLADPYEPGKRALIKVKKERTADVVVAGWREHAQGGVGSLMLGLWQGDELVHIGVASSFNATRRAELVDELAAHHLGSSSANTHPWIDGLGAGATSTTGTSSTTPATSTEQNSTDERRSTSATPRGANRWNAGKDTSWHPLVPHLVAEVAFDQLAGNRFRHSARFRRWRPDRDAGSCTFDQLDVAEPAELAELFAAT